MITESISSNVVWKPIPGSEWYEVSRDGQVRSWVKPGRYKTRREVPLVLKQTRRKDGYLAVGVPYKRLVHHLVAETFLGNKPPGTEIMHLDGDKSNNTVSNLAYGTPKENNSHKRIHGTHVQGERHYRAILTEDEVREIKAALRNPYYGQLNDLAAKYGVSKLTISNIKRGQTWKHVGEVKRLEESGGD